MRLEIFSDPRALARGFTAANTVLILLSQVQVKFEPSNGFPLSNLGYAKSFLSYIFKYLYYFSDLFETLRKKGLNTTNLLQNTFHYNLKPVLQYVGLTACLKSGLNRGQVHFLTNSTDI